MGAQAPGARRRWRFSEAFTVRGPLPIPAPTPVARSGAILGLAFVLAACNVDGTASPATPVAAGGVPIVSVATPAIPCCAPTPTMTGAQARASAAPSITTVTGAQATLAGMADSDVEFIRYDIAKGLSYSYGFSVHDCDGDGKPDISYFDSYTSWRARLRSSAAAIGHLMWNNGDHETIVNKETFEFNPFPPNPDVVLFERHVPIDINADGLMDIVGVANFHSAVVAYMNPGAHSLPWTRRVLSSSTPGPVNVAVADVNGDGKPNVIVAMRYQPGSTIPGSAVGIVWLENTGVPTGEWIYHPIDITPGTFVDPRTLQAADINHDGKVDIVVSDASTGIVAWYEQVTPDNWIRHPITDVATYGAHFGRVVDLDGDGAPDIVLPVYQGVVWLRNINHGASWELHPIVQFNDPNWENVMTDADAGDVHHDGSLDVAFTVGSLSTDEASQHTGGLYLAHMAGSAWTVGNVYQTDNSVVGVQLVDFDGSGYMDIVSNTEYQQNSVTLWKNTLAP